MRLNLLIMLVAALAIGCGTSSSTPTGDTAVDTHDVSDAAADGDDVADDTDEDVADADEDVADADEDVADTDEDVADTDEDVADADEDVADTDADVADTDEDVADTDEDVADSDEDVADTDEDVADTDEDVAAGYCDTDDEGFPVFSESCETDDECVAVYHQVDCCGTEAAIGLAASDAEAFAAAEAICRDEYAACRCATQPTLAQDGNVVLDPRSLTVSCVAGTCRTAVLADPVDCTGTTPAAFPEFDRSCATERDCAIVTHVTDCCGNSRITGIAATEVAAFEAAEAECRSEYPACGCPAMPPVTDAGIAAPAPETVEVSCRDAVCWTYVPL